MILERAEALGPAGAQERFITGVANVAVHEIGHGFTRHTSADGHDFMTEAGARKNEWLFDSKLVWGN